MSYPRDIFQYKQTLAAPIGCLWMQNCHERQPICQTEKLKTFCLSVSKQLKNNIDLVIRCLYHLHEDCNCIEAPFSL